MLELIRMMMNAASSLHFLHKIDGLDSPDDMHLAIPDFFKKGAPPDTIDFRRSSSGQNRCADENNSQEIEVNSHP